MIRTHRDEHTSPISLSPLWALAAIAGVLYGSLLPFSFDAGRLDALRLADVFGLCFRPTNLEDIITNLLVYLPVGFLAAAATPLRRCPRGVAVLLATLAGTLASLTAECLQQAVSVRIPSLTDVCLNAAGAGLGAVLVPALLPALRRLTTQAAEGLRLRPFAVLCRVMLVSLVAYHLAPFDVLTKEISLRRAFALAEWGVLPGDASASAWLTALAGAGWFAVWAYFAALGRIEEGGRPRRSVFAAVCQGVTLVIAIEVVQIMIRSHVFEIADIVWRSVGVGFGGLAALVAAAVHEPAGWSRRPRAVAPSAMVALMLAAQAGSILLPALLRDHAGTGSAGAWVLPFESLWRGSMLHAAWSMAADVIRYALLAATLAILLRRAGMGRPWSIVAVAVTMMVSAPAWFTVPAGAALPDLTRPILALVAALIVARAYPALRPA